MCLLLALGLGQTSIFQRVENISLDYRTWLRAWTSPTSPPGQPVLLGVDEPSLHDFGRWPWNREIHGDLLLLLSRLKPAVVAWDVMFPEPSANADEDEHFAKGIAALGGITILGASGAERDDGVVPADEGAVAARLTPLRRVEGDRSKIKSSPAMKLPIAPLAQAAEVAFVDTPSDIDGVIRQVPLVVDVGGQVYPTLSLRCLMEYWHATAEDVHVQLGEAVTIDAPLAKRRIPIDDAGMYTINYRHAVSGLTTYSYSQVHAKLIARFVNAEPVSIPPLTGQLILVGQVADGLADIRATPFSPLTPLVLVHANAIENAMQEDYTRRAPAWLIWLATLGLSVGGLARYSNRKLREQAVFSAGLPIAYFLVAIAAWLHGSWQLPVVGPVFGFGLVQVFMIWRRVRVEQRAKERIKGMFGSYVSPEVVNRLVAAGEMPRLGGHRAEITAYFSDIQGFSAFSEILPPERLVELMNEYLTACTDIVHEEGGTLDKYIGDAVVAMFGAPVTLPDHAYRACVAALRVQGRLAELRGKWRAEGDRWPEIVWRMQSRIGLNSGACVIGNMGSRTRFNYTMMGDNVNLGARMESGAKLWGTYAMCTEATRAACLARGEDRVVFRPLGRIVVLGRSLPVAVFEVAGLRESLAPSTRECVEVFGRGLEHYYARDWERAEKCFRESAGLEPNVPGRTPGVANNPSLVYLNLVAQFRREPPVEPWDGVFVMKEK
jgi:adenylate cyclase